MAFTPSHRGPLLSGAERVGFGRQADPTIRDIGFVNVVGTLADEAEYNLGGSAEGHFRAEWTTDEKPLAAQWIVRDAAVIVTSALSRTTTVLTAVVASGAAARVQPGQWVSLAVGNATYDGVHQVVTTTATTITFTVADSGSTADAGVQDIVLDSRVLALHEDEVVLFDAIPGADNQDYNLGTIERGTYTVMSDLGKSFIECDGAAFVQFMDDVVAASTNASVLDATSDTISALFITTGDAILRNGADAGRLVVTFKPRNGLGIDENEFMCLYSKREAVAPNGDVEDGPSTLRLKNRTGASVDVTRFERVR